MGNQRAPMCGCNNSILTTCKRQYGQGSFKIRMGNKSDLSAVRTRPMALNDITSGRWQHPYPRYVGFVQWEEVKTECPSFIQRTIHRIDFIVRQSQTYFPYFISTFAAFQKMIQLLHYLSLLEHERGLQKKLRG